MGETIGSGADFDSLPEGCVAKVLSLTTPGDACRLAAVSPPFRRAADSDAVWERFLPPDYSAIVSRAVNFSPAKPRKDLYRSLRCGHVLVDDGTKSFSIDKLTGKKCFMLSARDLRISWGDSSYWKWTSHPESRFTKVAELIAVCWLEIRGTIKSTLLSPSTNYAAYLVYKMTPDSCGFDHHQTEVSVGLAGGHQYSTRNVCLEPPREDDDQDADVPEFLRINIRRPRRRNEGWLRVELGEFYVDEGDDGSLEMSVLDLNVGYWKNGLIVEGIEIKPKETQAYRDVV